LLTTIVYVVVSPAVTVAALFVFVTARSASGETVSVSVAELLAGSGSAPPDTLTLTVLLTLPEAAVTLADTVNVTLLPLGRDGIVRPLSMPPTVGLAGHTAPPAEVQETPVFARPGTAGSISTAPAMGDGPALFTTMV